MPKVNREHLFEYRAYVPDLLTQRKEVEKLDQISLAARDLESIYQRKIAALDELKQSLLHQAFSGELTPAPDTALAKAGL